MPQLEKALEVAEMMSAPKSLSVAKTFAEKSDKRYKI